MEGSGTNVIRHTREKLLSLRVCSLHDLCLKALEDSVVVNNTKMQKHICLINVGLYRMGTSTLAAAARHIGITVDNSFPELGKEDMSGMLKNPHDAVNKWYTEGDGQSELIEKCIKNELIEDGWIALLPFLDVSFLDDFQERARIHGVEIRFIATKRDMEDIVQSELHHWVRE